MPDTQLDIVIPVFNEIEIIEQLHTRVMAACEQTELSFRIIYVDDGSSDGTKAWLTGNAINSCLDGESELLDGADKLNSISIHKTKSPNSFVTLLELSRNFGQPSAILAGLKQSHGECVVIMDGDLQDPPELIPEMVERWKSGDQV
ncbi:MAG: glycosyltransferase, partial [Mariniblastus sp.]